MKRLLKYKTFEAAEQVPHLYDLFDDIQEEIEQYFVDLEDIGAEVDYELVHIFDRFNRMRINKESSYSINDIISVINSYFSEDYTLYCVVSVSEEKSTYSFPSYVYNKETFDEAAAKLDDVMLFTKSGVNAISRLRKKYEVFWNGDIRNLEIYVAVKPTAENIEQKKELARKMLEDVGGKKPRIQKALDVIVNTSISLLSPTLSSRRISQPSIKKPLYEDARLIFFKGPITKGVLNSNIKKIESSLDPVNVTILDEDETLKIMQSIYDIITNKVNLKFADKSFSWKRYWKQVVILKLEVPEDKIDELLEKQLPDQIRKVLKMTSAK